MSPDTLLPREDVGAFVPHGRFRIEAPANGPLSGLTFLAKDLYDVAGHPTSAGNPTWLATHPVPAKHAALVQKALDAGATLVGKVITDELAYSINGDNVHYGTPVNVNAPGRVPGGSSSGSAAAAAAGLADFALGTDTGGSVRIPASFCGVWGIRTTHGLLSSEGVVPLAASFDTVGWLAADAEVFERVSAALLPAADLPWDRVVIFDDAWCEADAESQPLLDAMAARLALRVGSPRHELAADTGLEAWREAYVSITAHEAWRAHGAWIESAKPVFGDAIAGRLAYAKTVGDAEAAAAAQSREQFAARVRSLLGPRGVAIVPSAAGPAPKLDAAPGDIDAFRVRTFRITSIAGHAGLPQVSIPMRNAAGLPIGVSLIGPAGSDAALVSLAVALSRA